MRPMAASVPACAMRARTANVPARERTHLRAHLHCVALMGLLSATLLIAACAGNSSAKPDIASQNAAVKAAQNIERRASQSFAAGEFDGAAASYESAALVYETLALSEPQARARLSQARALADAGHGAAALQIVSGVLQNPAGLSNEVLATAHGRAAALTLESDAARAMTHVQDAVAACASTCVQSSAITVLRARVELASNNPSAAVSSASAGLAQAQNTNDRANALRVRALAHATLGQHAQAVADALQALQLDQDLGLATRVGADLQLLQRAYAALGDTANAARYAALAERAAAAGMALRGEAPK